MTKRHNKPMLALVMLSTLSACAPPTDCAEGSDCEDGVTSNDYVHRGLGLDLEDGFDHLERTNPKVKVTKLAKPKPVNEADPKPDSTSTTTKPSDTPTRSALIQQIRTLALAEQCDVRGAVIGGFSQGYFQGTAIQDGEKRTALFRGDYVAIPNRPGGLFEGEYRDLARSNGTLMGHYLAPGHHRSGDFGTFHGNWGQANQSDEAVEGTLAGLWLGQDRPNGGVFVGYWSVCDEPEAEDVPKKPEVDDDLNEG